MTTIQVTLPDELAKEAEEAGLLSQASLERMLRRQLDTPTLEQILEAMDQVREANDEVNFSPEAIAKEIELMRAEKHERTSA